MARKSSVIVEQAIVLTPAQRRTAVAELKRELAEATKAAKAAAKEDVAFIKEHAAALKVRVANTTGLEKKAAELAAKLEKLTTPAPII